MNNNKLIEAYIQMAEKNWYKNNIQLWVISRWYNDDGSEYVKTISNFTEEITSKEFIKAIAISLSDGLLECQVRQSEEDYEYITTEQAIAIRDNKLPDFIQSILPKQ